MRHIAEYLFEFSATGWGPVVMVLHAYLESFILPLAHELFLIPVSLATPKLSFLFALMSTTASIFGMTFNANKRDRVPFDARSNHGQVKGALPQPIRGIL